MPFLYQPKLWLYSGPSFPFADSALAQILLIFIIYIYNNYYVLFFGLIFIFSYYFLLKRNMPVLVPKPDQLLS